MKKGGRDNDGEHQEDQQPAVRVGAEADQHRGTGEENEDTAVNVATVQAEPGYDPAAQIAHHRQCCRDVGRRHSEAD